VPAPDHPLGKVIVISTPFMFRLVVRVFLVPGKKFIRPSPVHLRRTATRDDRWYLFWEREPTSPGWGDFWRSWYDRHLHLHRHQGPPAMACADVIGK